jgi:hypothetical protein
MHLSPIRRIIVEVMREHRLPEDYLYDGNRMFEVVAARREIIRRTLATVTRNKSAIARVLKLDPSTVGHYVRNLENGKGRKGKIPAGAAERGADRAE